jgi:dihydrofolate reductase
MPPAEPTVSVIAALARNGVIGKDNQLPWRLPDDLRRFKELTLGHPVVMGRKTCDSIIQSLGQPLPGRLNIVITRSPSYQAPGCRVVTSFEAAREAARAGPGASEVFVIGGADIYRLALPVARRMYLTEIHADFEGNARFPPFAADEWQETSRDVRRSLSYRYDFVTYERR